MSRLSAAIREISGLSEKAARSASVPGVGHCRPIHSTISARDGSTPGALGGET